MKRTYQGYSGSGQTTHNPAPLSYPPLPSGAPPPQPATSSSGPPNPSAVSNNPQYQTSSNPIPLPSSSQPYQYNSQYAAAAPYGQYPGYPPQQQAGQPYTAPIGPVAPGIGHYGYTPQLPQNPQQHQHQQAPHQQPQQPQHPAFPNYGYGATPGSQQPPKQVGQPYQPYPHQPNSNQLPANPNVSNPPIVMPYDSLPSTIHQGPQTNTAYHPQTTQYANPNNPNIPPNPYTAYPTGQPNAGAGLQGSPGSVAPPPYKRPRYEAGGSGTGYSGPNTHPTHGGYPPNPAPNHNLPPPALPPLRNQNSMAHSSPTPIRMGANTNSSHRGGFGGGGGRGPRTSGGAFGNNSPIRLNPGSLGSFDGTGAPHFDGSNHAHPPPHLSHPLPAHHQPPPAQHYQSNTFNNNSGANYSSHPTPHHGPNFNATNNADHSHSGPNHGTSTFAQPDTSYSSQPASNAGEHHYGFNDERGTSSRQGRGGFRSSGSGGRGTRDRGSDYGGGGMRGPSSHSNNNGRGDRANNNNSNNNNARRPPNHHRYDDNNRLRASRSIQNLSTPPGKPERRNNGRFSNPPIGGGNGNGPRAGGGGRRGKFEEGRSQSNHRTPRVGTTQHTTGGAGGSGSGPSGTSTRVRNGWGAQFKEFGEREKVQEKKEEVAPAKRTLTDFRINALELQELNWSWLAESSDPTPVVSTTVEESKSQAVGSKHGRDESGGDHSPAHSSSTVTATTTTKKVKSEASVELAKKIDEEAASAVKGLNLTVTDDQVSEQGESDEVKAQLLHTPTPTTTTTTTTNGPVVTDEPQQREKERVHSYSKPTIPAGRENSRLRLYFSSPTVEPLPAPPGLPSKPMMTPTPMLTSGGGGQGGKRKLSISAHSAMSVDTRIGGRGSSPMVNLNKAPRVATVEPNEVAEVKAGTKESDKEVKELEIEPTASTEETQTKEKEATSITDGTTKDDQPVAAPSTDPKQADVPAPGGAEQSRHEEEDADEDADGDYEEEDEDYEGPPVPEPQPDRLSISYARNTRRMVIDADVVEWIKVYRAEHKIEVMLRLVPAVIQGGKYDGEMDEYRVCKGVLVEALDQEIDDYVIIDRATLEATWNAEESKSRVKSESESPMKKSVNGEEAGAVEEAEDEENEEVIHDPLLPPLHRLFKAIGGEEEELKVTTSFKQDMILVVARLDTANPLTEAKWVRTGDVDSWISQMTGRIFKPEDKTECGWRRKITVVDPDPPPTIQHLLDTWLTTSTLGSIDTRQRFIDRHVIKNVDIIIEILLRVVRSGHTNPHHPMPLIVQQAATLHAPYPEQQTQVSLAVLGLYRLSIETALEGGVPMEKVVKKATDIVRSLPYRLAFSALDGIYKDETPS
ncbi:hypothetical protein CROQUDRAFT_668414 [Cronartium quercuum f. sp. fusiforme G11]|uniref:Uncharacterized protein n=1 Tax=Cronartium quercuum f. sp. fusiforme G11 TaxID=708437 RepID=A0A9P6NUW5_9BASI|nr:hypothetical protein CROQUDRAFT_668414 [Cronartium quercuum f. sp. fusiforme G11]